MKLSSRVILIIFCTTMLFTALLLGIMTQYAQNVSATAKYNKEVQPTVQAIQHLLTTIYDDFVLVEEYLVVQDYQTLLEYDEELLVSQEQCEVLNDEVEQLISIQAITDEKAIHNYRKAMLVYSSWQRSRNRLLQLHKEAVATKITPITQLQTEQERFIALMQESTNYFIQSIDEINQENTAIQERLSERTKQVQYLLIGLLILFIGSSVLSGFMLVQRITKPLDDMSRVSSQFTTGDYSQRIMHKSKVTEIADLQDQLNRVYALIDKTFKTKKARSESTKQLLPIEYAQILQFIRDAKEEGKVLTIKDIKKKFDLTHPTALARLRHLEDNKHIFIEKKGRNKYLYEA